MGKYFGTDGFRGEANKNLTADHAYKVGRFLGWYYGELKRRNNDETPAKVVIGKDTRRSSYMFEYSLVAGLVASGADAYMLHVTTTPSVAYITRVDDFDCGIMISASHNPYYDNGIKLINGKGEKMEEETIALVEAYIDGQLELFGENGRKFPLPTGRKSAEPWTMFGAETDISVILSLWVCTASRVLKWAWTVPTAQAGISQRRYLTPWGQKLMLSTQSRTATI